MYKKGGVWYVADPAEEKTVDALRRYDPEAIVLSALSAIVYGAMLVALVVVAFSTGSVVAAFVVAATIAVTHGALYRRYSVSRRFHKACERRSIVALPEVVYAEWLEALNRADIPETFARPRVTSRLFALLRDIVQQYDEGVINELYKEETLRPTLDELLAQEVKPLLEHAQALRGAQLNAHTSRVLPEA